MTRSSRTLPITRWTTRLSGRGSWLKATGRTGLLICACSPPATWSSRSLTAGAISASCAPNSRRPGARDQVYLLDFRGDLDERLDGPNWQARFTTPGTGVTAPVQQPHHRAAALGYAAVPDQLRPRRPPLASPAPRPTLIIGGPGLLTTAHASSARISSASPSCEKQRPMLQLDDHCLLRRAVTGTAILRLVCQFPYRCMSAGHRQACPTPLSSATLQGASDPLYSIQACRQPPIDIFLVDLPVIDCGGRQLP
jgi:hypothetical protein